jgi:hypothetical protein
MTLYEKLNQVFTTAADEEIINDVLKKCKETFDEYELDDIIRYNPQPRNFGYSLSLPDDKRHENENDVIKNKIGTLAEINKAIEEAKILDNQNAEECSKKYKVAEDTIEMYVISRFAKDYGYDENSALFDYLYSLARSNGTDIYYYFNKYSEIAKNAIKLNNEEIKNERK